ncbi:MAG: hypothetical protein K2G69_01135, partial [Muribaculaceae bacterium]|nr:hypothetical protein [Muribaculaceae bacterium]
MNFSSIYKKLLLLAAPLMLAACSSDEADIPSIPDEEFEGIVINVPVNNPITTRGELTGQEGTVSNLTVIAYNQATDLPANTPNPTVKKVDVSALTTEYQQVPMPLKAGDYHIYVVGNVTGVDWENLSETQLQNKTIATEPLTSDSNLPMSCNYLAIRKTPSTSTTWGTPFENGLVKINPKKTTRVYADLTFAVAKVKYTVINGKAKFLTMATTAADRVQVANYATEASLMGHIDGQTIISKLSANPAKVGAKGQYYKFTGTYVDKNDDGTPKGPSDAQKVCLLYPS